MECLKKGGKQAFKNVVVFSIPKDSMSERKPACGSHKQEDGHWKATFKQASYYDEY